MYEYYIYIYVSILFPAEMLWSIPVTLYPTDSQALVLDRQG